MQIAYENTFSLNLERKNHKKVKCRNLRFQKGSISFLKLQKDLTFETMGQKGLESPFFFYTIKCVGWYLKNPTQKED